MKGMRDSNWDVLEMQVVIVFLLNTSNAPSQSWEFNSKAAIGRSIHVGMNSG